jgi:hypothetical protein
MLSLKQIFVVALRGAALTPIVALCQETTTYKSEVNVAGFLHIVKGTTTSGVQQSTSLNAGVLAGYRFFSGRIATLKSAMAMIPKRPKFMYRYLVA